MRGGSYGYQKLDAYLVRLQDRLRDKMRDAMTDAALAVEAKVKEILAKGRKEWPSLSEATVRGQVTRARSKKPSARGTRDHILNLTGDYMRRVTHEVSEDLAIIGTPRPDAPAHEFGTERAGRSRRVRIPARPHFAPAAKEVLPEMKKAFLKRAEEAGRS